MALTLSNNKNELAGRMQKGWVMLVAKEKNYKHIMSTGADPTELGKLHYADVVNEKNCESFLHVNACNRNYHLAQCLVHYEYSFLQHS